MIQDKENKALLPN